MEFNKILFILKHIFDSIRCMEEHDIPASFILANLINETGWGKSELYKKYNNMFGLKYQAVVDLFGNSNHLGKVNVNACDGKSEYAKFQNYFQCTMILGKYIRERKWKSGKLVYGEALDILDKTGDVIDFCDKMGDIYAPNAKAVNGISKGQMLVKLIDEYSLYLLDDDRFKFNLERSRIYLNDK